MPTKTFGGVYRSDPDITVMEIYLCKYIYICICYCIVSESYIVYLIIYTYLYKVVCMHDIGMYVYI